MQSPTEHGPLCEALKTAAAMACIITPVALLIWAFLIAGAAL